MDLQREEGYIATGPYKVWYRRVGGGSTREHIPLLTLHGGPGAASYYIEDMQALASHRRRVILYDQLGCGRSDQPDTPSLWRIERFVAEIEIIRQALKLKQIHLWGQSWGGMLGIEYALTQPQGLVSLTLASATPSMPLWIAETNRLRKELPLEIQTTLQQHEEAGTTNSEEYQRATMAFYERYVIRLSPIPEHVQRSFAAIGQVYHIMNGPSEFNVTGVLKDWDRIDRLHEIRVPTLITSGRFDESTPLINKIMRDKIQGAEWELFEHSAHMAHIEETKSYMQTVETFLKRIETVYSGHPRKHA